MNTQSTDDLRAITDNDHDSDLTPFPPMTADGLKDWLRGHVGTFTSRPPEWFRYENNLSVCLSPVRLAFDPKRGRGRRCVAIVNIAVESSLHGHGKFSELVLALARASEAESGSRPIAVENVLTPRFAAHFQRHPECWWEVRARDASDFGLNLKRPNFVPITFVAHPSEVIKLYGGGKP
jgi:hypothetical protein